MSDVKKKDGASTAGIAPLPWEKGASEVPDAEDTLFDLLGSDPDFQDEEDPKDSDELESDESEEDEDDETGDDEDDDEDLEDEDDEDEDDDSEEDEDDEDDEDEDEDLDDDDEPETRKVKVDGKVIAEVTFDEAIAGYSRTEDYTRKRQADSAEQATAMTEIGEVRDKYASHLEQLQAVMESMTPKEPNWDEIRAKDPGEYAAQKQDHADRLKAIEKVAEERQRVADDVQKKSDADNFAHVQGEMVKLIEGIDGWQNDAVRATGIAELRDFAIEAYGYTSEQLDSITDHRMLLIIWENKQARAKVKKGKKEIRRKSRGAKKLKPGSTKSRRSKRTGKRKANEAARNRLAQSGSVQDAADTILGLLSDDD